MGKIEIDSQEIAERVVVFIPGQSAQYDTPPRSTLGQGGCFQFRRQPVGHDLHLGSRWLRCVLGRHLAQILFVEHIVPCLGGCRLTEVGC